MLKMLWKTRKTCLKIKKKFLFPQRGALRTVGFYEDPSSHPKTLIGAPARPKLDRYYKNLLEISETLAPTPSIVFIYI